MNKYLNTIDLDKLNERFQRVKTDKNSPAMGLKNRQKPRKIFFYPCFTVYTLYTH